jgi:hypothetical protein
MDVRDSLGAAQAGVFEERLYHTVDARAHARNAARMEATISVLRRHGMHLVGFWDVVAGAEQSTLYYLVRYHSLAERTPQWEAFGADPERAAIRAAAEAAGPLFRRVESNFLQPTAFSPLR